MEQQTQSIINDHSTKFVSCMTKVSEQISEHAGALKSLEAALDRQAQASSAQNDKLVKLTIWLAAATVAIAIATGLQAYGMLFQ